MMSDRTGTSPRDASKERASRPPRILALGDAMVDAYLSVDPVGISDEAPVIVADCLDTTREMGGLLNMCTALRALGADVHVMARLGLDDEDGHWVRRQAAALGFDADWLADASTITARKMRVVAKATSDYLARLDHEVVAPLPDVLESRLHDRIRALVPEMDAVVVSDYAKGFMSHATAGLLVEAARASGVAVIVDGKPGTIPWYAGATVFTPNVSEACQLAAMLGLWEGRATDDADAARQTGAGLADALGGCVLITCGAHGMYLYPGGRHIAADPPIDALEVGTTSGAGDIVTAVLACETASASVVNPQVIISAAQKAARLVAQAVRRPGGTCRLESAR